MTQHDPESLDAQFRGEILELAELYELDAGTLTRAIEGLSFNHYVEYVLAEQSFELVTGGLGREQHVIAEASARDVPTLVIDAFERCASVFPGKMVYFKQCFGRSSDAPTLYLEMMEGWDRIMAHLDTIASVRAALPALERQLGGAKVCALLAFSLDTTGQQLRVKLYSLCDRARLPWHQPLMVSHRLAGGELCPNPKYYRALSQATHAELGGRLADVLASAAGVLTRQYWSLHGYRLSGDTIEGGKVYVFRQDRRFETWGPRHDSIYTSEGNVMLRLRRFHDAIESYTNAIDYLDRDYVAYCNRALCYALVGEYRKAVEDADVAKGLEPNMNFKRSGAYSQFIREMVQLFEQSRSAPDALSYNRLGVLLFSAGLYQEAKQSFASAVELDARLAEAYNNLGGACINLGEYSEAFEYCSKAISLDDHTETSNYMLALEGM
ncbi:MAG TPA: tetratricopeptide repeat protein, partial [Enhygromyxa sp.]|nr:tetratricopeptide repeat protein [Enhygromyxa sp.]